jgi:aminoglycoside N3'-acetyltransferase
MPRAAIGSSSTLVMPSWTGDDDEPFDLAITPASTDLGVAADANGVFLMWAGASIHLGSLR